MSTIYLYVKQHSLTGLRYFGMMRKHNPYTYKGSGKYWLRHIRANGEQFVLTTWVRAFLDSTSAESFALAFSSANNIVESDEWANLIVEDAKGGRGIKGRKQSDEERLKRSRALKGKPKSEQHKLNLCKPKSSTINMRKPKSTTINMKKSDETRMKMSGRFWITNGVESVIIRPDQEYLYPGYYRGRKMPSRRRRDA